jgi:phospholipid/cholesterol/gamma-HCH transport system permease protein
MNNDEIAKLEVNPMVQKDPGTIGVRCSGSWTIRGVAQVEQQLQDFHWPAAIVMEINGAEVRAMDTSGAWLLHRTKNSLTQQGRNVRLVGFRPEFESLMALIASHAVPRAVEIQAKVDWLARVGLRALRSLDNLRSMLEFVGESALAMLRMAAQPRRIRWRAIFYNIQIAGFEALPIVGLLTFLMGVVIAYQGADQLQRFGANIFIADLVGLAMLRELAPLLTAIIIAGRSGSAYAAQIGTMKVTEEIDALRTIGVSPQELLVQPKILALMIALPLLTLYGDVAGVFGGMIMARSRLDVSFDVFIDRLGDAVSLSSFLTGLVKAPVFAAIIALVGCFQGLQVGGSADSVGRQTTLSVVQSIFLVIVADALFSVVFNLLNL